MTHIEYRDGYLYQLETTYVVLTPIIPATAIHTEHISLEIDGTITIREGYAWDGPSGPTIDTPDFMRGSLVHDALYQLMREDHLDHAKYRAAADKLLHDICIEDGMTPVRAWWVYEAVSRFGEPASDPASTKPVLIAPKADLPKDENEIRY